jgi:hypothetical protein
VRQKAKYLGHSSYMVELRGGELRRVTARNLPSAARKARRVWKAHATERWAREAIKKMDAGGEPDARVELIFDSDAQNRAVFIREWMTPPDEVPGCLRELEARAREEQEERPMLVSSLSFAELVRQIRDGLVARGLVHVRLRKSSGGLKRWVKVRGGGPNGRFSREERRVLGSLGVTVTEHDWEVTVRGGAMSRLAQRLRPVPVRPALAGERARPRIKRGNRGSSRDATRVVRVNSLRALKQGME